jgi:hypothetical protein
MHGSNESSGIYSKQIKHKKFTTNGSRTEPDTLGGNFTSPTGTAHSDQFNTATVAPAELSPIEHFSNEFSMLPEQDPSPASFSGLTPFSNWNEYDFFGDLNQTLPLNPTHPTEAQLELLMSSVLPETFPSHSVVELHNSLTAIGPRLLRIPSSDEIPIKGEHLGLPPPRNPGKRLNEIAWTGFVAQVEELNLQVAHQKVSLILRDNILGRTPFDCRMRIQ